MPKWEVHNQLAEICGIPRHVMATLNRFIDCKPNVTDACEYDPKWHDANRVIIDGHWEPRALLYLAMFLYEWFKGSCLALKAALHHHLVDYLYTVITSGKYGWEFKELVRVRRGIVGDARVCEEDSQEVMCVGAFARDIAERFGSNLLEGIIRDFVPLIHMDDYDLLETLLKDFPQVFDDNELRLLKRLQAFGELDIAVEDFSAKLKLVRDTARCLVRSADELGNCIYKVSKGLSSYRCRELLKSG